ncbi:MAG: hypothetical protein IH897_10070, partial [Planctomycetes bacterium]|nr:hypothetical protein [Planctomycetota bacterium]
MLRQCREMGIGFIIVDQCPSRMSAAALANCYASVCLNLKDPSDLRTAAGLSLVDAAEKHCFSTLSIGTGVVKLQDRWHRPVLVRFPLVDVPKGAVT